jgi:hypothetical protein
VPPFPPVNHLFPIIITLTHTLSLLSLYPTSSTYLPPPPPPTPPSPYLSRPPPFIRHIQQTTKERVPLVRICFLFLSFNPSLKNSLASYALNSTLPAQQLVVDHSYYYSFKSRLGPATSSALSLPHTFQPAYTYLINLPLVSFKLNPLIFILDQ